MAVSLITRKLQSGVGKLLSKGMFWLRVNSGIFMHKELELNKTERKPLSGTRKPQRREMLLLSIN